MKFTSKYLRIAFSVALLGVVAWHTDWSGFAQTFQKLRIEIWLLSVGLLCVTQVVSAARWQMFAKLFGFSSSLPRLTAFYFIGMYFNLLLPTSVGGDVVRAYYLNAESGRHFPAFISVVLDRLSGLLVLLALACLGVILSPLDLPLWIVATVWGLAGSVAAGFLLLLLLSRHRGQKSQRFQQINAALPSLQRPRLLLITTLLSIFVQVANVVIVMIVGYALELSTPGSFYWILVPVVTLLTLMPLSVNGMGVREGATALLLAPFGVNHGAALSLALAWFAVHAFTSLFGGVVYVFGRFARPIVPGNSNEVPDPHGSISYHSDQGRTGEHRAAA